MRFKAGQRIKAIRELVGMTQVDFAKLLNLDYVRIRNVESLRVRASEDEFNALGLLIPEFLLWLVCEGEIKLDDLRKSDSKYSRLVAAKIDAGQFPDGYDLEAKFG